MCKVTVEEVLLPTPKLTPAGRCAGLAQKLVTAAATDRLNLF
jgi:hypothetical protein